MTSRVLLWATRLALPVLFFLGIAVLSRLELGAPPSQGVLRLAWRMAGERAQLCRDYTAEEIRSIPKHMQRGGRICEQTVLPYRLRLSIDGTERLDVRVRPGGLRGDRPLFVQEDFPLAPGHHGVAITFGPSVAPAAPAAASDAAAAAKREALRAAIAAAPRYALQHAARIAAGRIVLVDLDQRSGTFRVLGE